VDKLAFNYTIFSSHILNFKADENGWLDAASRMFKEHSSSCSKSTRYPDLPLKEKNPCEGYSGVISRGCPSFLCYVPRRKAVDREQAESDSSVHPLPRSSVERVAPDAFSQGLDTGMMHTLHNLAVSPPTAFALSHKDSRAAKYLEQATHLRWEEQAMLM